MKVRLTMNHWMSKSIDRSLFEHIATPKVCLLFNTITQLRIWMISRWIEHSDYNVQHLDCFTVSFPLVNTQFLSSHCIPSVDSMDIWETWTEQQESGASLCCQENKGQLSLWRWKLQRFQILLTWDAVVIQCKNEIVSYIYCLEM